MNDDLEKAMQSLKDEVVCQLKAKNEQKDIIIVVHDQLDYVKECIESIYEFTDNFHLYIWDNASKEPTKKYLESLIHRSKTCTVSVIRNEENKGFIIPNNQLAGMGQSPYLILLNSDTRVSEGWDKTMLGYLQTHPEVVQVGYLGGVLDQKGNLSNLSCGADIDYVMAWATCIRRSTYEQIGLFDEDYQFAYFEDSDLSLRLKDLGKLYVFYLDLVYHHGNATIKEVKKERCITDTFNHNYQLFLERWDHFLREKSS